MTPPMTDGYAALTDKEKQTLRLIVRGHDAKSIARHLGLSVHTINERLRDARRKLAVSSSREAARLLLAREGTPDSLGPTRIGDAAAPEHLRPPAAPDDGGRRAYRPASIMTGVVLMTFLLGLLVLASQPQPAALPAGGPAAVGNATAAAVEASARQWLALIDQGRWEGSWQATGAPFRKLNSSQTWAEASTKVRAPLGAVISRTLISQEELPAPPSGYIVVKFRTSFARRADTIETVTLDREDGGWRVVGIMIG